MQKTILSVSILLFLSFFYIYNGNNPPKTITELNAYFPFIFSKEVNPRDIVTVGDQVVSEHTFAFHSKYSIKKGFAPLFSNIELDSKNKVVTLSTNQELTDSSGKKWTNLEICHSIENSINKSNHVLAKKLVTNYKCENNEDLIEITFKDIPVNLHYLFTLADLAIADNDQIPLTTESITTGPYTVVSLAEKEIELKINPYYPTQFRANQIEKVNLKAYSSGNVKQFIEELDIQTAPLAYLYGYSLNQQDLDTLKKKKYNIRQMPSEWLLYIGLNAHMPQITRLYFSQIFNSWKDELLKDAPLGQTAYSISPSDRPFGLTQKDYINILENQVKQDLPASNTVNTKKKWTIGTLDEWAEIEIIKNLLTKIKNELSHKLEIKLYSRANSNDLWSDKIDMIISPLGIAPADPVSTFNFLTEYRDIISEDEIIQASIIHDPKKFSEGLKSFETRILENHRIVPLGHFPGVVIEAPYLNREEELAWSWGIQSWTYSIH